MVALNRTKLLVTSSVTSVPYIPRTNNLCTREDDLPRVAKRARICQACKMDGGLERKKGSIAVLTPQIKIKRSLERDFCECGVCKIFKVNVPAKFKTLRVRETRTCFSLVEIVQSEEIFCWWRLVL